MGVKCTGGSFEEPCDKPASYRGNAGHLCDDHWRRLQDSAHRARKVAAEVRRRRPRDTD
jgi:hypothetical protein